MNSLAPLNKNTPKGTPVWFLFNSLGGSKAIFQGFTSVNRVKVKIADGQPDAGTIWTTGASLLTLENPHSPKTQQVVGEEITLPAYTQVPLVVPPVQRPAASLSDILTKERARSLT